MNNDPSGDAFDRPFERPASWRPKTVDDLIAEWRFEASVIDMGPIGVPQAAVMRMCADDLEKLKARTA